jgi:hypothetical protein
MKKRFLIILLVIILLLAGCQAKKPTTPSPSNSTTLSTTTQATTPPAQLDNIESDSEDIIDDVANNDWAAAQSKISDMKTNFSELKPILVSASVSTDIIDGLSSAIDGLDSAIRAKKSYDARALANKISKYVPDIYDYYTVTIPTDVSRLDYLGREIILNVENSDWSSASSNYETAGSLWSGLKLKLNTTYKNDIDSFQSNMDALKSAIDKKDSTETTKQATTLLENVDTLETDFTNQNKA